MQALYRISRMQVMQDTVALKEAYYVLRFLDVACTCVKTHNNIRSQAQ